MITTTDTRAKVGAPASTYVAALKSAKRSKYNNRRVVIDGLTFDSAKEARRWTELQLLQRAGKISELKRQVRFPIEVNGQPFRVYVADASYRESGEFVLEDTKGGDATITEVFKMKADLIRILYGITVRIV